MPRIFTEEFKKDAVALVESGISQKQVAADLGVSKTALQTWVRDAGYQSHGMTPASDADERKEMSQALKRIRELEMENEVLRKAAAYLSQPHIRSPK
ncbi:transposase [Glutamicibacter protophormiae]|uniref:Transposase n=1 Tax=Glutamicibacter protophormiae TaxID=37930 RepID=A0ABS4XS46_GLUPR|nr:transposase [Glutamicibacter protophormiae]GGL85671.1 transposase [Glutamicibacter protophormiae]